MEASTLDWLVTLLAVHVLWLVGVIHLFKGAPCWMQRISVGLLVLAFALFCAAYIAAICRLERWWLFLAMGAAIEHLAVMLYVFRIWWQGDHGHANRASAEVR